MKCVFCSFSSLTIAKVYVASIIDERICMRHWKDDNARANASTDIMNEFLRLVDFSRNYPY